MRLTLNINIDEFRNRDDFVVKERDSFILIHSSQSKKDWTVEELKYRSIMCDKEGNIISSGFPKFFNYGENKVNDEILDDAIYSLNYKNHILKVPKLDGTLIIRDVIDGKVHFRTRNNFDIVPGGEGNEDSYDYSGLLDYLKSNKNSRLCSNKFGIGKSLLFEWTSPKNKLIVKYCIPQLSLLGFVDLSNLSLTVEPSSAYDILHRYPDSSLSFLDIMNIKNEKDIEGYVISTWSEERNSQVLFKVKTDWYYKLFNIRYMLNQKKFNQICWLNGLITEVQVYNYFKDMLDDISDVESQLYDMHKVYIKNIEESEHYVKECFLYFSHIITKYNTKTIDEKMKDINVYRAISLKEDVNTGIYILRDKEEKSHQRISDLIGSRVCNVSMTQFRNLVKENNANPVKLDLEYLND